MQAKSLAVYINVLTQKTKAPSNCCFTTSIFTTIFLVNLGYPVPLGFLPSPALEQRLFISWTFFL